MTTLAEFSEQVNKGFGAMEKRHADLEGQLEATTKAADKMLKEVRGALNTVANSGGAYGPPIPGRVFSSEEKATAFAGWCRKIARGETKDLDGLTDSTGAPLIPDEFRTEIIRAVESYGQLMRLARRVPIGLGKVHFPTAGAAPTCYWLSAGATIPDSEPGTGGLDLQGERLGCLVPVDNYLLNMEPLGPSVGEYLAVEMARSLVKEIERVMAKGAGIPGDGKVTGILNSSHVTIVNMAATKTAFTDLVYDNLVDLEGSVIDTALGDARYVMSRSILAVVKKMKDNNEMPIWHPPAGSEPAQLNGYNYTTVNGFPVAGDSAAATPFIAFGDFRMGVMLGEFGNGVAIDMSEHYRFSKMQTCFRALTLVTAEVVPGSETGKNPIAVLKTAAS